MDPFIAGAWLLSLIIVASLLGLWWKRSEGRVRRGNGVRVDLEDTALSEWPRRLTLLQFSTEFCARCPGTRRYLRGLATEHDGVAHTEIDLTNSIGLASKYDVRHTPTIFVLDGYGRVRAVVRGAPKPEEFRTTINTLLRSPHDDYAI